MADPEDRETGRQRIDKWLWHARVVKTRTLAKKLSVSGRVRKNRKKVASASETVRLDDVLTVALDRHVRVLKVTGLGDRRGPAAEARLLYEDLSPPLPMRSPRPPKPEPPGRRSPGAGRPTKRERRRIDAFRDVADD